jgi:transposase-like protein
MSVNGTKTKKHRQRMFMRALLLGYTIVASAKLAGISERSAFYWLKEPGFQAERKRLETELYEAEQAAIKQAAVESIRRSWNERFKR